MTKPATKAAPRKRKAVAVKTKPRTSAGVLQDIRQLLALVDAKMTSQSRSDGAWNGSVAWSFNSYAPYQRNSLGWIWLQLERLRAELAALSEGKEKAEIAIRMALTTPIGKPLTWALPGTSLLWIGDIPVRLEWGGFMLRDRTTLFALSARQLFLEPGGSSGLLFYSVGADDVGPEALAKGLILRQLAQGRNRFYALNADGQKAVLAFRNEPANSWWTKAISKGPVDPISIPLNTPSVQTSLFA
jgi:hypothetical protein